MRQQPAGLSHGADVVGVAGWVGEIAVVGVRVAAKDLQKRVLLGLF